MRHVKLPALAFCAILLLGVISPRANADEWNKKTVFTFSGPVEIPGFHGPMVLPAGTYVFKLLDSQSDRNVVQIFDQSETHLYATILAIPDYRMKPTGKTVVTFQETAEGSPEAIKAWFYPGDNYGQEFVYPKSRAVELARATNEPVLSMPEETSSNIAEPIKSAKEPAAVALEQAPMKAEQPSGQEVEYAEVVMAKTLPKTASEMPLAALGGLLLAGLGAGLGLLSRRFA